MNKKSTDAENSAKLNQMGTLHKITKQLCKDRATPLVGIRGKEGDLSTQDDLVRERWKEHFKEVLNRPMPMKQALLEPCLLVEDEDCLDIDTSPLTVEQIRAVIKHRNYGKTPGVDGIDADLLKVDL